jgi:hypothetical protein
LLSCTAKAVLRIRQHRHCSLGMRKKTGLRNKQKMSTLQRISLYRSQKTNS